MATATVSRNDVYLSLLAGRAITALADLADNSAAWNDQIKKGLEDGIAYCHAVRAGQVSPIAVNRRLGTQRAFKRLATHDSKEPSAARADSECKEIERLLGRLVTRSRKPRTSDLIAAIEFFTRNAGSAGR